MTTISVTYCYLCEAVENAMINIVNFCDRAGTARAASQLSIHGFHDEAKALMLSIKDTK